eukprot:scaffold12368_cov38-Prasinocladus_malaysianus.AAC.2
MENARFTAAYFFAISVIAVAPKSRQSVAVDLLHDAIMVGDLLSNGADRRAAARCMKDVSPWQLGLFGQRRALEAPGTVLIIIA